jgi:tripeptide aminopeptidase
VGYIEGGGRTNVIPDLAIIRGEVRAFNQEQLQEMWTEVEAAVEAVSRETGMEVQIKDLEDQGTPVWEGLKESQLVTAASKAAKQLGLNFSCEEMSACLDANGLARWGKPVININHGGANPHSYEETITVGEMEKTKRFIIEIIKACQT